MPKAHFYSQVISDSLKAKAEAKKMVWKEQTLLQYNVSAKTPGLLGLRLAPVLTEESLGDIWNSTEWGQTHSRLQAGSLWHFDNSRDLMGRGMEDSVLKGDMYPG